MPSRDRDSLIFIFDLAKGEDLCTRCHGKKLQQTRLLYCHE